ncbi:MAG: transketolase [Bacteriovoracaceae bacterium]|jgi:transketolase
MRKRCLNTVYELAKKNDKIVFIGSDLGYKTLEEFKNEFPNQFIMEGISEQNLVGMSAGIAEEGKIVYTNTIATFITRRSCEQNILNLGLLNANVRLIGNGGGLVYAPLGPTHLATDDIALTRLIPNMTIIVPTDADEMERAVRASEAHQGPIYFRLAKGGDPIVSDPKHGFEIGKAIIHKEAADILLIACGIMVQRALTIAEDLAKEGISVGVTNVHTIKPLDTKTISEQISKAKIVLSLEEHSKIGGLGSAISELISESKDLNPETFKRVALPDCFPDQYGSQDHLIERYEIGIDSIKKMIKGYL